MDTEQMGPATPPREAAMSLYQEAMQAWRNGDLRGFRQFLRMARDCAVVAIATEGERQGRGSHR